MVRGRLGPDILLLAAGGLLAFVFVVVLAGLAVFGQPTGQMQGLVTGGAVAAFVGGLWLALVALSRSRVALAPQGRVGSARDYLDALPVAVFVLDRRGRPSYANALARRMLGKGILPTTKPDELSAVYPSFYAGTTTPYPPAKMPVVRALGGEEGAIVDDVEIERRGKRTPIEARAKPVRDASGRIQGSIAVFHDISGRREAERERAQRIEQGAHLREARAYEVLRRGFVNRAAHDLFTPMTPMRIDLLLLGRFLDEHGDKTHQAAHRRLTANLGRLHDVAQHLLEVAQIEADQARLQPTRLDLAGLVRDQVQALEAKLARGDPKVRLDAPEQVWIEGDGPRLAIALGNVLAGATRLARPHSTVDVSLSIQAETAVLEIRDQGDGMAAGDVEHFFEPFWDASRPGMVREAGLGLGLFVSRAIVHAHGGTAIAIRERDGSGATIRWTLPLAQADAEPDPSRSLSSHEVEASGAAA